MSVTHIAEELVSTVNRAADHLRRFESAPAAVKPAPGKWSKKEILGHLLDSAVNNHHRFVRAQTVDRFVFPDYEQDNWVDAQDYNAVDWESLISLWTSYNHHLAHVISKIPTDKLNTPCEIGPNDPVTLQFLAENYLVHMNHHLRQLEVAAA